MQILYTVFLSLSSIVILFFLVKIMGNREMTQFSMFDYINGITIGSIAAEFSTAEKGEAFKPLIAMIVYAAVVVFTAWMTNKSLKMRRFINGKALILYDNGNIYFNNLKKTRLDLNEFLVQCRIKGYFKLDDIQTAVIEPNGSISILPVSTARPANPKDMGLNPKQDYLVTNVIVDGRILYNNLSGAGYNEAWLKDELIKQNAGQISGIFLATVDKNGKVKYYKYKNDDTKNDRFSL